jgi:hypothetical protein
MSHELRENRDGRREVHLPEPQVLAHGQVEEFVAMYLVRRDDRRGHVHRELQHHRCHDHPERERRGIGGAHGVLHAREAFRRAYIEVLPPERVRCSHRTTVRVELAPVENGRLSRSSIAAFFMEIGEIVLV